MSTYSREDLHTDRSIQLDSESDSPQRYQSSSIYLDKLEAQMAFMEKEFRRNIEWQRSLINEARKEQKKSSRH